MSTKILSFMKHQSTIRIPVKFHVDSTSNIRFSENNIEFTVFPTIAIYHKIKPTHVYVDYTCTGYKYIVLIQNKTFAMLYYDSKCLSTTYGAIVGIGKAKH